jgi:uncharacterized protein YndB with AHSA1/START domain
MNETIFTVEPGKQEITIRRKFEAPRELVFKAFSDPQLIPQWWGPARYATTVDKMEVRPGGMWRFSQRDSNGNEFAFHGFYHQVLAPERLVYTFEFEGVPGHIALETIQLEAQGDETLLTDHMVFQSQEDRDGMYESGMEDGSRESLERIEALLIRVGAR